MLSYNLRDSSMNLQRTVTLIRINNVIKYELKELQIESILDYFFDFLKMDKVIDPNMILFNRLYFLHRCTHPCTSTPPPSTPPKMDQLVVHVSVRLQITNFSRMFRLKPSIRTAPSSPSTSGLGRCVARRGGAKRKTRATTAVSSCAAAAVTLLVLVCVSL